jgi:hypothetical protein
MGQILDGRLIASASGGGTAFYLARCPFVCAAGANNNIVPTGFGVQSARIILTAPSGVANITGLQAGTPGQSVAIINADAANMITLNNRNAGSAAANQFFYFADMILPPGTGVIAVYDATLAWTLE